MTDGIKVALTSDIPAGEGIAISSSITGTADDIAIFHDSDDSFWALDNTCTHEPAPLSEGWVEKGEVECPWHASKFCLKTGAVTGLPATKPVRAHKVEVRGEEIWLFPDETPDA